MPRRVLIAGASGLIGRALVAKLGREGARSLRLVRREPAAEDEIRWNPATGELDPRAFDGVDAVVNLSGENVGAGRWTAARRKRIVDSRVDATRTLVRAMAATNGSPPAVLVNASAIGIYGDRGAEELTEASAAGTGFLADVCGHWEAEAAAAERAGVRVGRLRFGAVLAGQGGALAKLLPVFRAGLGGPIGAGQQWMSWIGLEDAAGVIVHVLRTAACDGAVNAVAPAPVTSREFAQVLGRVLHRPAFLRTPAIALRVLFGQMADETVLASARAIPSRLVATGYAFSHPTLDLALRATLPDR